MHWWRDARDDLRFGCRRLWRERYAAAAIVLVLACGIGVSIAVFTVADAVLVRPLPVTNQHRLVVLWGEAADSSRTLPLTPRHFERFRDQTGALQEIAGTVGLDSWPQAVRDGDETLRLNVSPVTGNFFQVLGARAILGRMIATGDDRAGAAPVAVLSHSLWRGRFAGSPAVLGRRLQLRNARVVTIVGVAPPGLEYPVSTDVWVPFAATSVPEVVPLARLAPTATADEAAATLAASFAREAAGEWPGLRGAAVPLDALIAGDVRPPLLLLTAAATLVLVAACLNVSNLLLLRGVSRREEMAVRQSLGASHGRIVRQLLVEGVPLALAAGALGAWSAALLVRVLVTMAPAGLPRLEEIRISGVPLGLALVVGGMAAVGSGVLPALWLAGGHGPVFHGSSRTRTAHGSAGAVQRTLVILQAGFAVFVLFLAGLLGRTLGNLERIDTGFAVDRIAVIELAWPETKFDTAQRVAALYDRLAPRLEAVPHVMGVSTLNVVPFTGATGGWDGPFVADGSAAPPSVLSLAVVGAGYFETMGIQVQRGRGFDAGDRQGRAQVAVVSAAAARLLGGEQGVLGRRIRFADAPAAWRTIVGVAADTRYRALRQPAPTVYLPLSQFTEVLPLITTLAVRTDGPPGATIPSIREAIGQVDADLSILRAVPMRDFVTAELTGPRLHASLVALFAGGTLLLAVLGLYAVVGAGVRARRRELAIREVLGATPARLRRMVVMQGVKACAAGLTLGLGAAIPAGGWLGSILYGVAPGDAWTVFGVVTLLATASVAAAYLPARAATGRDLAAPLRDA